MTDISTLVQYEQLFDVPLKVQRKDAKGRIKLVDAGVTMRVASFDSPAVARVANMQTARLQAAQFAAVREGKDIATDVMVDHIMASNVEKAIAAVREWDWGGKSFDTLGVDPACTEENKRFVFTHPNAAWIVAQIVAAGDDIANFLSDAELSA